MDIAASFPEFAHFMWSKKVVEANDFNKLAAEENLPMVSDLLTLTIGSAILITMFRWGFEALLSVSFVTNLVKAREVPLPMSSTKLEDIYQDKKKVIPDINEVKKLSLETKFSVEQINKWFHIRQRMDRNQIKVNRFRESVWRLLMYSICVVEGWNIVSEAPYYKNTELCWQNMLSEPISERLKYYYVGLQIPLYLHLVVQHVFESRSSSDGWEMRSHHVVTVILLLLSYVGNLTKIGAICLVYHDVTDILLESAKVLNYLNWEGLSNLTFFGLLVCWGYSRIYKFLFVIFYSLVSEAPKADVLGPSYHVFLGLLTLILILNLYWFYAIASMAYRILWAGSESGRDRAMTDLSTDDDYDSDDSAFRSDSEFSNTESKKYN